MSLSILKQLMAEQFSLQRHSGELFNLSHFLFGKLIMSLRPKHRKAYLTLLLTSLLLGVDGSGIRNNHQAAIANDQFACPRAFYQIINNQLKKLDPLTGQYLDVGSPVVAHYNAAGYNPIDDFIYGYGRGGSINGRLVKIAQDGTLTNLGIPTRVGGVGTLSNAHSGDFDDSGNLWLRSTLSGARLFRLNVTTNEYVGFALSRNLPEAENVADWVYIDGKLYGGFGRTLYIIDLSNQTLGTTLPVTTISVPELPAGAIFGAGYTDVNNNLYLSDNAGALYQVLDYDTPTPTAVRLVNTTATSFNDGMACPDALPPFDFDFGDAPDTTVGNGTDNYSTLLGDSGPFHLIDPNLSLGSGVTPDADGFGDGTDSNSNASDDTDDAFGSLANIPTTGTYDLTNIPVNNASSAAATLHAWIDFDKNGQFAASEYQSVSVPQGTTTVDLSWSIPGGTTDGTTYARFRLTTDSALTDTAGTAAVDERSVGLASDGEVEDYQVAISAPPIGGPRFLCEPDLYIVTGDSSSRQLYRINRASDPFTFDPIGNPTTNTYYSTTFGYNALGFNPIDGYMYGLVESQNSSAPYQMSAVVRIDANGDVTSLGVPQPAGGNSANSISLPGDITPEGLNVSGISFPSGTVLLDGTYVISSYVNGGNAIEIYTIDVTTSPPTVTRRGLLGVNLNDMAVNPQDTTANRVYAISETQDRLVYFDVTNPGAGVTNVTAQSTGVNINYGSQFYDNFGNLYFRSATTSALYRLNTDGVAELITSAPTGGFHDGASCLGIDIIKDVSTTDPVPAGEDVTYTYQIANSSLSTVTIAFEDDLRSITDATGTADIESETPVNGTFTDVDSVVLTNATGTSALSNADQTLTISNLTIPPQTVATIEAAVTVPASATPDTYYNQATIGSLPPDFPTQILSDYLPGTIFKEPTPVVVIEPVASDPDVVLVKRITAINGATTNPNDSTNLTGVVNDGTANSPDDEGNWPTGYLLGQLDAGLVKPGDQIEYTVYFLNAGNSDAENVRICDWIQPNQSLVTGLYDESSPGARDGNDIELSIGGTTYQLTAASDTADRAVLTTVGNLSSLTPDLNCNVSTGASASDNVLVLDITGTTGEPTGLTTLPGTTGQGAPNNAYGFFRFTTQVDE